MGAGRFVGRVGTLAVALGVGATVTLGTGTAWADTSGSSSSSSPDGGNSAGHAPSHGGRHAAAKNHARPAREHRGQAGAEVASSATDSTQPTGGAAAKRKKHAASAAERFTGGTKRTSEAASKPVAPRAPSVAGTTSPAVTASKALSATAATTPTAAPVAAVSVVRAIAVDAPVSAVSSSAGTSSVASALSVLFGGGSGAPALAPVSWVLAAAARRELATAKTVSVATEAVVATGPAPLSATPIAASVANAAPAAGDPVVHDPDPVTGVVTGNLNVSDADGDSLTVTTTIKPKKGAVVIDAGTGDFTYTPTVTARHVASSTTAKASALSDTFTVKVTDGQGGSTTQTVTVAVAPANAVPTVTSDLAVTKTSATGVVTGKITVTDMDKDTLKYTATADKGKVSVSSTGVLTYTPTTTARHDASATGATEADKTATVAVTVTDGHGGSLTETMTVDITPKNTAAKITTTAGTPNSSTGVVTGTIKTTDADKDSVTVTVDATSAKGGAVVFDTVTSKYTYTPTDTARHDASTTGATTADKTDTFTVMATDGHGDPTIKVVTVSVKPINTVPAKTTPMVDAPDAAGVVTGTVGVTDANADTLTYTASKPAKGTVTVNTDGTFTYTPTAAAMHASSAVNAKVSAKSDTFTVKVVDGQGGTVTEAVTVPIAPANTAPTMTSGPAITATSSSTGVVTGKITATDADNDTLTYTGAAEKGTVKISSTGVITYTPTTTARHAAIADDATEADKTDTVTITVSDSHGATLTQTLAVPVTTKNTAPTVSTTVGTPNSTTGVVTGTIKTTDADKDSVTVTVDATSAKGGAVVFDTATGKYTYTPTDATRHDASATGATKADKTDTFTLTADDGHGGISTKIVTVTVKPQNAKPTNPVITLGNPASNGAIVGTVSATDIDGDTLALTGPAKTSKGAIAYNGDGTFTYTPTAAALTAATKTGATAAAQADSFTVTLNDGHGGTITAAVTLTIAAGNTAPTITSGPTVTATDDSTGVVTGQITATDADNDPLTYTGTATKGTVQVSNTGIITYTPTTTARHAASADGATDTDTTDTVTITVSDGRDGTTSQSMQVTIAPTNTAPIADTPVIATPDPDTGVVTGTVKATDAESDSLTYSTSGTTPKGMVIVDATTGAFTYTPSTEARNNAAAPDATADSMFDTFTVNINDGHGGITTYNVNVTVVPSVSAPISVNVLDTIVVPGQTQVQGALSPDGTRAVVVTNDNDNTVLVSVFDTITGSQIGNTNTITAIGGGNLQFNATGTRAVITAFDGNTGHTMVSVFDTATGEQIGTTTDGGLNPYFKAPVQLNDDGTRALIIGNNWSYPGDGSTVYTSTITIIDLATGTTIYSGNAQGRSSGSFSGDGTRIAITTMTDPYAYATETGLDYSLLHSTVTFMDTMTGDEVGSAIEVSGKPTVTLNGDGSRAVVSALTGSPGETDADWSGLTTSVNIVDTATGLAVGAAQIFAGVTTVQMVITPDDSRAVASFMTGSGVDDRIRYETSVTVLDMTTGEQIGSTITAVGMAQMNGTVTYLGAQLVANGTRALLDTTDVDYSSSYQNYESHVVLIDPSTGAQLGQTITLNSGALLTSMSGDDSHAALYSVDASGSVYSPSVTVIDLTTGNQTSIATPEFDGLSGTGWVGLNHDGSRIIVVTFDGTTTTLTTHDSATGAVVGSPVSVAGTPVIDAAGFTPYTLRNPINGDYATLTTSVGESTTNVTFVNVNTGAQIGQAIEIDGQLLVGEAGTQIPMVASDGTHALALTGDGEDTAVTMLSLAPNGQGT